MFFSSKGARRAAFPVVCASGFALPAQSQAAQSQAAGFTLESTPSPVGIAALAYGTNGELFIVGGGGQTDLFVLEADGQQRTIALLDGVGLTSPGGAVFNPATGELLVTDNLGFSDGQGELFSIDPLTGRVTTLASGIDNIDDVAVRSTGEIFVSDAAGSDAAGNNIGTVQQINPDGTTTVVLDGLGFAAGLDFNANGDLLIQDVNSTSFTAEIIRLGISELDGGALSFDAGVTLASGLSAGFDLAVDSEDDVFITGSGGLFELDRDEAGAFLGTASLIDGQGFSTELDFLAGTAPFEANGLLGDGVSGQLSFVPSFGSQTLTTLTVPEPAGVALLALCTLGLTRRRKQG